MILLAVAPLQTLGISHSYVSLTWICGPIAGFVVSVFFFHCFFDRIFSSDKDEDFLHLPLNFSKIFAHAWKRLAYDLLPS